MLLAPLVAACGGGGVSGDPSGDPSDAAPHPGDPDGAMPGDPDGAMPPPPGSTHLAVLDHDGTIHVWNDLATLTDRAADGEIAPGAAERLALAAYQDRLVVASKDADHPLAIYQDYWTAAGAAAPIDQIPASAMAGAGSRDNWGIELRVGPGANLWAGTGGGVWLLADGVTKGGSVGPAAYFTHEWLQIPSFAYDPVGKRLVAGQISGAGVLVWDNPLASAAGTHAADWTLDRNTSAWWVAIADGRLYGATDDIAIWNDLPALDGPHPSDLTLGTASGIPNSFIPSINVQHDVLVVSVNDGGPITSIRKVNLYRGAHAMTGDRAPDQSLVDVDMLGPQKTYLDAAGTLYILDGENEATHSNGHGSLYIYDHALDAPVLRAHLTTGLTWPRDFVVVE